MTPRVDRPLAARGSLRSIHRIFGENLQRERKRKAWSVEVLAAKSRLKPTVVRGLEQGGADVKLNEIESLARALSIDASVLLSRARKKSGSSARYRSNRSKGSA